MREKIIYFAGGGTGGHIYPAIAVAEQLKTIDSTIKTHFFCSNRDIDSKILSKAGLQYTPLPAKGFSVQPGRFIDFCRCFLESVKIVKAVTAGNPNAGLVGVGGFVAGPACWAAKKKRIPISLVNVDIFAGKANKLLARWADDIFVQFEQSESEFAKITKAKIHTVGCPLRSEFANPQPGRAIEELGLDRDKKILLITGASSGAVSINNAICLLLDRLGGFANGWQIVHLTGSANYNDVVAKYASSKIGYKVLDYYDQMADLLAAAELVIGRSGAVSVAEYAAAGAAVICMPYPHHKNRHQYYNAEKLVEAGAGVIVDDLPDEKERADWLWEELENLLKNDGKRKAMRENSKAIAKNNAAVLVAEKVVKSCKKLYELGVFL